MTITIELPDDICEAVQLEANYQNLTVRERIERIIIKTHEHRVFHSRAEMQEHLKSIDRGEVVGDGVPFREFIPALKGA